MPEPQRFCLWCQRPLLFQHRHARFCNSSCRNKDWVLKHRKSVEKANFISEKALLQPEGVVNDVPVQESVERRQKTPVLLDKEGTEGGVSGGL